MRERRWGRILATLALAATLAAGCGDEDSGSPADTSTEGAESSAESDRLCGAAVVELGFSNATLLFAADGLVPPGHEPGGIVCSYDEVSFYIASDGQVSVLDDLTAYTAP